MTTSASRRMRSARNALAEALGLGETFPLRDLPLAAEPAVASFGALAKVVIEDSEPATGYRLRGAEGAPLPDGAVPQASGTGADLTIATPPIAEDITFTVEAVRPNGRSALLLGAGSVKVGLDASLPVSVVSPSATPAIIDYAATVELAIERSQEGVTYRLVGRPFPDRAAADDVAAMAADIPQSGPAGVRGTGGTIRLLSVPLLDDTVINVRAAKVFAGPQPRPPQTTLLSTKAAVFVRADIDMAVTATPGILDHGGGGTIALASSAARVTYVLYAKPIADAAFSRAEPRDPATLAVSTPGGEVRVVTPPLGETWEMPPGYAPLGEPVAGTGAALAIPLPPQLADTLIVIQATKRHGEGAASFTSAERLRQPVAVLVRPDPRPPLRLAARVVDGKLSEIDILAGQSGVFYALAGAAPLGELYLHQRDPGEAALNKGVGALAVTVDLVVAGSSTGATTTTAPPPLPSLAIKPLALPVELAVTARRATTGLTTDLGKAGIAAPPKAEVQPATVLAGAGAKVVIAQPVAGERYAVAVSGRRLADPVAGGGAALSLDTGPLVPGAAVELWITTDDTAAGVQVERRVPLAVTIG